MFLEPPTARPHRSLTMLLQLTVQWMSPSTLGVCSCRDPTPEVDIRFHEWEAIQPQLQRRTQTHCFTHKTYLKERTQPTKRDLYQESILGQDYQELYSPFAPNLYPASDVKSHSQNKGLGTFPDQEIPKKPNFPWRRQRHKRDRRWFFRRLTLSA